MLARIWKGTTKPAMADRYVSHLQESVIPELGAIPGFRGIYVLRRAEAGADEFLVLTLWESLEAGERIFWPGAGRAVGPPKGQALRTSKRENVRCASRGGSFPTV